VVQRFGEVEVVASSRMGRSRARRQPDRVGTRVDALGRVLGRRVGHGAQERRDGLDGDRDAGGWGPFLRRVRVWVRAVPDVSAVTGGEAAALLLLVVYLGHGHDSALQGGGLLGRGGDGWGRGRGRSAGIHL